MPAASRTIFPLVPRYRVTGIPLGGSPSLRRGYGSDVAGSRPYTRADPISTIDWRASARLSTAHGRDEFVVRERFAEEAPRVVIMVDAQPSMALYERSLPWLSKPAAVRSAVELVVESAVARNAPVGYLDFRDGSPYWLEPTARGVLEEIAARCRDIRAYDAPGDTIVRGFEFLARFRSQLSSGTFVFVVSDFLGPDVPDAVWLTAAARRWEIVPVVIQDETWEQSFPLVHSVVVPLVEPGEDHPVEVRLSRREALTRRALNEGLHAALTAHFQSLGLDPVVLGVSDDEGVDARFAEWAAGRRGL
ncbi:MAG TPA: DUF58 domain-containing protein [Gaiellaceae bacterium]|nr:DUF58 domain-containing protein [Gaiellaceae bacterium]